MNAMLECRSLVSHARKHRSMSKLAGESVMGGTAALKLCMSVTVRAARDDSDCRGDSLDTRHSPSLDYLVDLSNCVRLNTSSC